MIRGGAATTHDEKGRHAWVHQIDVVDWMVKHFSERDFVMIKMDVEGAEHSILQALLDMRKANLIDLLLWECHGFCVDCLANCERLRRRMGKETHIQLLTEEKEYRGWDTFSTPSLYFPLNPT